jgi:uncharacterized protein YbjT (DUF2867 family)
MSYAPLNPGARVVVAGATGYAGGHVARALHAAGYRVRALARDEARLVGVRDACDEVFVGEATRAATLDGLFDGVEIGFSSIGIRHVHRRPTIWEVDCQANLNLVEAARRAGVRRFVFVSVFRGEELRPRLDVVEARERVVDALASSGMDVIVLRPTGFFNDMSEFFGMARRGRVWLLGDGSQRLNPIHGADIGDVVAERLAREPRGLESVPLGGPDVLSLRDIGELAFRVQGREPRFSRVPAGVVRAAGALVRPFNTNLGALLSAFAIMNTHDGIAPALGRRRLEDFFRELARGN